MWRRSLNCLVLAAGLFVVPGCQSTGSWFDGGDLLSRLPFTGGAPSGQTEPDLVLNDKPKAERANTED